MVRWRWSSKSALEVNQSHVAIGRCSDASSVVCLRDEFTRKHIVRVPCESRPLQRHLCPATPNAHGHVVTPRNQKTRVFVPRAAINTPSVCLQRLPQTKLLHKALIPGSQRLCRVFRTSHPPMPARIIHPIRYAPLSSLYVRVNVSRHPTVAFPVDCEYCASVSVITESARIRIKHRLVLARLHRCHRRDVTARLLLQFSLLVISCRALNQPPRRLSSFVDGDSLSNCQLSFYRRRAPLLRFRPASVSVWTKPRRWQETLAKHSSAAAVASTPSVDGVDRRRAANFRRLREPQR